MTENYRGHKSVHTTRQEEEPHKEAWSFTVTSTLDLLSESQGQERGPAGRAEASCHAQMMSPVAEKV